MSESSMQVAVNAGDRVYAITNPTIGAQMIHIDHAQPLQNHNSLGVTAGGWTGEGVHIGDFPDWIPGGPLKRDMGGVYPYYPPYRIEPSPWEIPHDPIPYPKTFQTVVNTIGYLALSAWTIELTDDSISLSTDMPGVKLEDMKVEITSGVLTVTGVRHDKRNGANTLEDRTNTQTYQVQMYLAESANAILLDGVLTVKMLKREEFKPKVVKVKVK